MSLENTNLIPEEEAAVEAAKESKTPEETLAEEPAVEEPVAEKPAVEEPAQEPAVQPEPAPAPVPVKPAKKPRRKPHIALRILLQLLSFFLSVVLFASVLAGVALADLRQLTSAGGIKQLISAIFTSAPTVSHVEAAPVQPQPAQTYGLSLLSSTDTGDMDMDVDIDLDDIPEDLLTGGSEGNVNGLVDWLYDQIAGSAEEELTISREQVQSFVEKSTVSDYLAEELAAFADDFINGTENAQITTDELMDLLEENEELLKSELQIELNPEVKEKLETSIEQIVVENDINTTIRQTVYDTVDSMLESSSDGMNLEYLQETLQLLTSGGLFWTVAGVCLALVLLLCLLNFYNVPAGLTWASIPCILAGILMSLPILILQSASESVISSLPEAAVVVQVLSSFIGIFAPIHYGLLGTGVGLLVISIVWRIVRTSIRKKKAAAAVG